MSRIVIVTDSTCDLPPAWIQRFDIRVVPTYVNFDQESLADDGVQLRREHFYERLTTSPVLPTTAAPPLGEVQQVMAQALADADFVIGITAPAKLSGIYNTFRLAAENTDPSRVTLIDSGTLSMGLGWQVVLAAELAGAEFAAPDIKTKVLASQPYTDVWAALDTFEYVHRSGRVGWAAAMMGDLFQIKPIIRLYDSVVSSVTRVRTAHRAFQALVDTAQAAAPLQRLAIMHTRNIEGAQRLLAALADIHPDHEPVIVEATPVIGVHVGPKALGLAVVRKN